MLIAIMGNTFDRVIENQQLAKLKLKVKVLSDFIFFLRSDDKKYLYLATPKSNITDIDTNWEGKITAIRNAVVETSESQKEVLSKKLN